MAKDACLAGSSPRLGCASWAVPKRSSACDAMQRPLRVRMLCTACQHLDLWYADACSCALFPLPNACRIQQDHPDSAFLCHPGTADQSQAQEVMAPAGDMATALSYGCSEVPDDKVSATLGHGRSP